MRPEGPDIGTALFAQRFEQDLVFPYCRYSGYKPIDTLKLDNTCNLKHLRQSSTSYPDLEHSISIVVSLDDTDDLDKLQGLMPAYGKKKDTRIPKERGQNQQQLAGIGTQLDSNTGPEDKYLTLDKL